jgi:hypothetical protein
MALQLNMKISLSPEMRQLAMRIGLGALVLALAAYVLVGMPLLEERRLIREIDAAKAKLARQQKLMPAIASLNTDARNATLTGLAAPKQEPAPRAQAYLLTEQLQHMGTAAGLEPLDVSLNTATMNQDPDSIQAQGVFAGQIDGVRALLLEISRMPSLSRIERVEIRAVDGRLEMMVLLRVALGN